MTDSVLVEFDRRVDQLYFHFDVNDHFIRLDTFVKTAESARKVIEALDVTFCKGHLEYEMIVLPPAAGTFLSKLALYVSGGTAALFAFLNTEIGAAYIEGLTGRSPADWAESFGQDHKEFIEETLEDIKAIENDETEVGSSKQEMELPQTDDALCKEAAQIVVAMVRGILEKPPDELKRVGMEIGALPDAVDARAEFFTACIEDREVKRVGFSPEPDFPIPRHSFPERALKQLRRTKDDDPPEWTVAIDNIFVTSPNWDKEDQKTRQWKGKDQVRRDCYFIIEDAEFWHHVRNKALNVEVLDNLKVQWAFQNLDGRPKNRRVLRVLEFNGEILSEPLPPAAVRAILGSYSDALENVGLPTLFD